MGRALMISSWNGVAKDQISSGAVTNFLLNILHQFLRLIESPWRSLVQKFDQLFPPETRAETLKHWFVVGGGVALAIALLVLLIYFMVPLVSVLGTLSHCLCIGFIYVLRYLGTLSRCLCIGFIHVLGYLARSLSLCCGVSVRMMTFPGLPIIIPRAIFECCPRLCFMAVRGKFGWLIMLFLVVLGISLGWIVAKH